MAVQVDVTGRPAGNDCYARSPEQVAADLGADPAVGLWQEGKATDLLTAAGAAAGRGTP